LIAAAFAWCEYATRRHSGGQQGASKVPQTYALKSWQCFAAPRAAGRAPAGADCVARRQGGGAYSLLLSPLYCECGCSVCRGWRASSASLLNQQQCWALPWCGDCLQAGGQCCRHQTSTCCYLKSGAVSAFHSLAAQLCPLLAVDSRPSSVALRLYAVCCMVYRQRSSGAYCTFKAASSLYAAMPCRCGQHRERASAARPWQVERLASEVEAVNPNKASLSSPLVNGKWRLLYTTSSSILGTSRPPFLRPGGDIYQTIGAPRLHGLPCCPQRQKP